MDLRLTDRRALVLGSSSGLGRAVAAGLAAEGARVAVTSRDKGRATDAAAATGAEVALTGDLTVAGDTTRLVAEAASALGGLDILVVNTGGGTVGGVLDTADADEAAFASMLRPALEASRSASPWLRASGTGRLIFLTARSVLEASPDLALSSIFRSGVVAAARSLALELAPDVLVNVIATGQFDTPGLARYEAARAQRRGQPAEEIRREHEAAIPLGRVGRADELADVVVFLCSARASFVNGTVMRVDGGAVLGF